MKDRASPLCPPRPLWWRASVTTLLVCLLAAFAIVVVAAQHVASTTTWDPRAAAGYMDARQSWWMTWPNAARDHDTACVSCHTALPYALARPALRAPLAEREASAPERKMLEQVTKRVRLWKEVEPFYPDQTRGLPKTSESRGTEAILNAAVLSARDASLGTLSDDTRQAFENMWPLQFKAGEQAGGWAWLNFHNEPWEAPGSQYFGNSLAAIALGTAPGGYAALPANQERVKALATALRGGVEKADLLNRAMILWASSKIPGVLTPEQSRQIVDDLIAKQQGDGGWNAASLAGDWKRNDSTPFDMKTDGYATGLVTYVLQLAGRPQTDASVARGLGWLVQHQDRATGMWTAVSLNKQRDPATDIGKFLSDAATSYAVLALTR